MKSHLYKLATTLVLFLIFCSVLSAQAIVRVEKSSPVQLNLLEKLQLRLCFEMETYIILATYAPDILSMHGIHYQLLTDNNAIRPLVIVSPEKRTSYIAGAYVGEIVIDEPNIRVERLSSPDFDFLAVDGVRFLPVNIQTNYFQNTTRALPLSKSILQTTEKQSFSIFDDIISSVNADSVAWFIQNLEDFQTRFALAPNRFEVSQWIADQFTRMGYTDVVQEAFFIPQLGMWQRNVVVTLPGSHFPDQYVVVGAHHDSAVSFIPDWIQVSMTTAPGANDNASGTAAVLEIARVMKLHDFQPLSSIRFLTFAAEELGLYGAYHDVGQIVASGMSVVAMINSDMIAHNPIPEWHFVIRNYPGADFLTNMALDLGAGLGMTMHTDNLMINASDSWAYHNAGIPSIFFMEAFMSPQYHSVDDLLIHLNPDYAAQFVKLKANLTLAVSCIPSVAENFMIFDVGNGSELKAVWDASTNEEVSYILTVKDTVTDQLQTFETTENEYIISGLTEGTEYEITLYAFIMGHHSLGITRYERPLSRPRAVEGVSTTPGYKEIVLAWQANRELDIAGYKIFRKEADVEVFSEVAHIMSPDTTTWTDSNTADKLWYTYKINAVNNAGNLGADGVALQCRHASLCSGILIIDLTHHTETSLLLPPKERTDLFYRNMVSGFRYSEMYGIDHTQTKLEDIGIYSTLLIYKNSFHTVNENLLMRMINPFIAVGGNVFLSANDPLYFSNLYSGFYPETFSENSVIYNTFGITTVDYNHTTRFSRGISTGWHQIPDLEVDPTKTMPQFEHKLNRLEVFAGDYTELYTYYSDGNTVAQRAFDGMTVALHTTIGDANILLTSIPLYFIQEEQAKTFMQTVLRLFGEINENDNNPPTITRRLDIKNYPNPFNPTTTIQWTQLIDDIAWVDIYNVKGQLVRSYPAELYQKGDNRVQWDGVDEYDTPVASGIYFVRVKTENGIIDSKKMVLLK